MTSVKKRVFIIGGGVMGNRFAQILAHNNCAVTFYQYSKEHSPPIEYEHSHSLDNLAAFDACFICSPTSTHKEYLKKCIEAGLHIFIEKPISDSLTGLNSIINKRQPNQVLMVGFNLRTLPVIQKLRALIPRLGKIYYAHFDIGQYLPLWRPGKDYTKFYSAHYHQGGGVALDLIHEVDLALSLFPSIRLTSVKSGKLSNLTISVEDYTELYFDHPKIRITLDYLSHNKTRRYHLVGEKGSIICDVVAEKLEFTRTDGRHQHFKDAQFFDRELSFVREVENFLALIEKGETTQYNERDLGIDALRYVLKARKKYV